MFKKWFVRLAAVLLLAVTIAMIPVFAQDGIADEILTAALERIPQSAEYTIAMNLSAETENGYETLRLTGYGAFVTNPEPGAFLALSAEGETLEIVRTPRTTTVAIAGFTDSSELEYDETYAAQFYDPLNYEALLGSVAYASDDVVGDVPAYLLTSSSEVEDGVASTIELWLSQETFYPLRVQVTYVDGENLMDMSQEFYSWESLQALLLVTNATVISALDIGANAAVKRAGSLSSTILQECGSRREPVVEHWFLWWRISLTYQLNQCEADRAADILDTSRSRFDPLKLQELQTLVCDPVSVTWMRNECHFTTTWMYMSEFLFPGVYSNALRWATSNSGLGADITDPFLIFLPPYVTPAYR